MASCLLQFKGFSDKEEPENVQLSQKTYLGLTGKVYKDCLQGPVTLEGAWKSPELNAAFSSAPETSEFAATEDVLPEGPLSSRPQNATRE